MWAIIVEHKVITPWNIRKFCLWKPLQTQTVTLDFNWADCVLAGVVVFLPTEAHWSISSMNELISIV